MKGIQAGRCSTSTGNGWDRVRRYSRDPYKRTMLRRYHIPIRIETLRVCADAASSEVAPGEAAIRSEEGAAVTATRRDCSGALLPTAASKLRLCRHQQPFAETPPQRPIGRADAWQGDDAAVTSPSKTIKQMGSRRRKKSRKNKMILCQCRARREAEASRYVEAGSEKQRHLYNLTCPPPLPQSSYEETPESPHVPIARSDRKRARSRGHHRRCR